MYKFLTFVHVFAVVAMLGPTYLLPALSKMRGDPPSVTVLKIEYVIEKYATAFAVVALVTGIGLIESSPFVEDFGEATWLHIAITLFLIAAGLGTGYAGPRMRKAVAAGEAGDAAEVRRLLDPLDKVVGPILGLLAAAILYLMLIKPEF